MYPAHACQKNRLRPGSHGKPFHNHDCGRAFAAGIFPDSVPEEVIHYVKSNYKKEISLNEAAGLLNVSPEYFCRLFKKQTGQTFLEYLNAVPVQNVEEFIDHRGKMKKIPVFFFFIDFSPPLARPSGNPADAERVYDGLRQ